MIQRMKEVCLRLCRPVPGRPHLSLSLSLSLCAFSFPNVFQNSRPDSAPPSNRRDLEYGFLRPQRGGGRIQLDVRSAWRSFSYDFAI